MAPGAMAMPEGARLLLRKNCHLRCCNGLKGLLRMTAGKQKILAIAGKRAYTRS